MCCGSYAMAIEAEKAVYSDVNDNGKRHKRTFSESL